MQEEIENRSVTLIISGTKLTGRVLKAAIAKYLAHRKEKKNVKARAGPVVPHGRQTVKQLVGQNAGVSNIEITDSNIRSFDRVARKYGVDYAVKKGPQRVAAKISRLFQGAGYGRAYRRFHRVHGENGEPGEKALRPLAAPSVQRSGQSEYR